VKSLWSNSSEMAPRVSLRWVAIIVIAFSSFLNYLDRQLLPALAPTLQAEFGLSNAGYGLVLSAFSLAYALCAPLAGWVVDRLGLERGIVLVVALWSLAGMGTGFTAGLAGLLLARALLGAGQAGGVPSSGKAVAMYLPPSERALGTATTQIGLSLGAIAAPLLASWFAAGWGWRAAFVFTGALGFAWIPVWLAVSRRIPPEAGSSRHEVSVRGLLRDPRLWGLVIATLLYMNLYSLWSNWTTVYLVEARGMSELAANRAFAWIPPLAANAGGLAGGWVALRWMRRGVPALAARMRVNVWCAALLLGTAAVPWAPTTVAAVALICGSFFFVTAMSVNVYAMPLDLFGPERAALATAALTGAYGLMQTFASPAIGGLVDRFGFGVVCAGGAVLPLGAVAVLQRLTVREES